MAVPDFQSLMLPIVRFVAQATTELPIRVVLQHLADEFQLSEEDRNQMLPSGRQAKFDNRVYWAATHLRKAKLLEAPKRAMLAITPRGHEVLARNPDRIDLRLLAEFPEFQAFRGSRKNGRSIPTEEEDEEKATPLEALENGFQRLRAELATEILEKVITCSPEFFENLVVELLLRMGYGGSRSDAGRTLGRSGDGGIDGIIKEDRLGLDSIFIQAKRWSDKNVGRPELQQFAGALAGQGVTKGVFIASSAFSSEAAAYVEGLKNCKIVLIDGEQLAEMMIDHGIGVTTSATYEVKRMDGDYFAEAEA